MPVKDILQIDSSRKVADIATFEILENPFEMKELVTIILQDVYPLSMRAARILYIIQPLNQSIVEPYMPELIERLPELKVEGARRGILRVLTEMLNETHENYFGLLLHYCFEVLLNPAEKIAIRALSADVLYIISKYYPDIRQELKVTLDQIMEYEKAALLAKARIILKKIAKEPF